MADRKELNHRPDTDGGELPRAGEYGGRGDWGNQGIWGSHGNHGGWSRDDWNWRQWDVPERPKPSGERHGNS